MVAIADIKAANAKLTPATVPRVSVFVGGTSGIGKATIARLVATGFPLKVYVVGRPSTRPAMDPFLDSLRAANPRADLVWVEGEVALLADVKRICGDIEKAESAVDLLFLSAGYAPWGGRNGTSSSSLWRWMPCPLRMPVHPFPAGPSLLCTPD